MGLIRPRRLSRAASPTTGPVVLAAYLWHPMPWVARVAATNNRTPRWALRLARKQERLVDVFLVDLGTSNADLRQHALDSETAPTLLHLIATHPNAETDVLRWVAAHPRTTSSVQIDVLRHAACPPDLAAEMSIAAEQDSGPFSSHDIQRVAVSLTNAAPDLLAWFAHNCDDRIVLNSVAQHPNSREEDAVAAALKASTAEVASQGWHLR